MGILLLYANQSAVTFHSGAASLELTVERVTQATPGAQVSLAITFGRTTSWSHAEATGRTTPDLTYAVAFDSPPLAATPAWEEIGTRVRGLSTRRGRSYEFDRMETGTMSAALNNRDAALSPENTASGFYPIKSTRPVRAFLAWGSPYALFRGITGGFPQAYPHVGKDALVELGANDLFYALNNARFTPGSTALGASMAGGVEQNTEETITVTSTALPMPQAVPFTISVAGLTSDWPEEEMEVTEIVSATQWLVTRSAETTYEHPAGAAVTTTAVSFGEALSGERIRQALEAVGFTSAWYDLDDGQSLIAPSGDLADVSPLEHINLVAEAEFGRFFVSRAGLFTFRDRHSIIVDNLTPVMTFRDSADTGAGEVPYTLSGSLEHTDEKLYNRIRITIEGGDYDGEIVDMADSASVDEHFERVYEKTFPYANINDADSAARFVLTRNSEDTLRVPAINVQGAVDPDNLWPALLAREIGERVRFRYQPEGGGDEVDKELAIDGIGHQISPGRHVVTFQCTEVDDTNYWILGRAGYTELGSTTRVGF